MRHRNTLASVERVVTQIRPIVEQAALQASVQEAFRQMARDRGVSVQQARREWIALQEADLMLESGGDPDAISASWAEGVAQWLATTGQGAGLSIQLNASRQLTGRIRQIERRIAWLEYRLHPRADLSLPDVPRLPVEEARARRDRYRSELQALRVQRRRVDARYDPRRAIFAQTRYLLRLYRRFPSADWLFQAYHGGEGGVTRTLQLYLGHAWPGTTSAAIRKGRQGRPLRFADVYENSTPRNHPEAFTYLYGRSDDHRHYWWKLLACREVIAQYRRDPVAFRTVWEVHLPGRGREAAWYPSGPAHALVDETAIRSAIRLQVLIPVPVPSLCLPDTGVRAVLQPEAAGLLRLIVSTYRQNGGRLRLRLGDMTLTAAESQKLRMMRRLPPPQPPWPPDPDAQHLPGGGPPPDFDYHTTGLAFDILWPENPRDRKILDYAIGFWEDRQVLARREERDTGPRRWHLVPNPRYAAALRL